jgi:hypothetical protein
MKFISDFVDFYDFAGFWYDNNIVYNRKREFIKMEDKDIFNIVPEFFSTDCRVAVKRYSVHLDNGVWKYYIPFVVVFCGVPKVGVIKRVDGVDNIYYTFDDDKYYSRAEQNFFNAKRNNVRSRMLELELPIVLITQGYKAKEFTPIKNPRLIDYKFHEQMNATDAYQEMEMFVGEMQTNEKTVNIGNEYLKKQKGFSDCSFKNCKR